MQPPYSLRPAHRSLHPQTLHQRPRKNAKPVQPPNLRPKNDLERTAWPERTADFVTTLREAGQDRSVKAGEVLFDVGE